MTMTHTGPRWEPTDAYDLLDVLADPHPVIGADVPSLFLSACERDASSNDGQVSVNRVRALLADEDIEPHRYSALWAHFTGLGKPMAKATTTVRNPATGVVEEQQLWEVCEGSQSGNNGRPYPVRRWLGTENTTSGKA